METTTLFGHTMAHAMGENHIHQGNSSFKSLLNNSTTSTVHEAKGGFISHEVRILFDIINFAILTELISFCGVITNSINFIVFLRQGVTDSITISLVGLAISDFGASLTHVWMGLCNNPLFADSGIPFNSPNIQYLTAGWPHVCFTRITGFITAYITFERCLCIVMPLKVKNIITPRRTFITITLIYLVMIITVSPAFFVLRIASVFHEEKNRSLIDLIYRPNGHEVENVSLLIQACSQVISLILVMISSLFLVHRLREKSKWRKKSASAGDTSSTRDNKVVNMVLTVAIVFIVCYLPSSVQMVFMTTSEEYSIIGRYKNEFHFVWSFLNVFEATNSAVNIFVYYKMSSKFRTELRILCCCDTREK